MAKDGVQMADRITDPRSMVEPANAGSRPTSRPPPEARPCRGGLHARSERPPTAWSRNLGTPRLVASTPVKWVRPASVSMSTWLRMWVAPVATEASTWRYRRTGGQIQVTPHPASIVDKETDARTGRRLLCQGRPSRFLSTCAAALTRPGNRSWPSPSMTAQFRSRNRCRHALNETSLDQHVDRVVAKRPHISNQQISRHGRGPDLVHLSHQRWNRHESIHVGVHRDAVGDAEEVAPVARGHLRRLADGRFKCRFLACDEQEVLGDTAPQGERCPPTRASASAASPWGGPAMPSNRRCRTPPRGASSCRRGRRRGRRTFALSARCGGASVAAAKNPQRRGEINWPSRLSGERGYRRPDVASDARQCLQLDSSAAMISSISFGLLQKRA